MPFSLFLSLSLEKLYLSMQRIKHPPFLDSVYHTKTTVSPTLNCLLVQLTVTHSMFSGLALNTTCTLALVYQDWPVKFSDVSTVLLPSLLETFYPWHSTTPNSTFVHSMNKV